MLEGEETVGQEAYQYFHEVLDDLAGEEAQRQYLWVAQAFPPAVRRNDLSWSHFRACAALAHERLQEAQERLAEAAEQGWTADQLSRSLRPVLEAPEICVCAACGFEHRRRSCS